MSSQSGAIVRACAISGFVLLSALYSGCQLVETRDAHDPYYEQDGMWCGNYALGSGGARIAVIAALTAMKMPLYQEGPLPYGIFLDTRTPDNFEVRIEILPLGSHAEGSRICVRVGGFGTHREVCKRLLDEITRHLDAVREVPAVSVAPLPPPPVVTPILPAFTATPPRSQQAVPALPPQPVPLPQE